MSVADQVCNKKHALLSHYYLFCLYLQTCATLSLLLILLVSSDVSYLVVIADFVCIYRRELLYRY